MRIIAEAGCNWQDLDEAKMFIDKSKELGLFACKFQMYNEEIIKGSKDYEFLEGIRIDFLRGKALFEYGQSIGQEVFFTPMYPFAVDICEMIGVNYYKLRFCDRQNQELIKKVIETNKPFFISVNRPVRFTTNVKAIPLFCVPKYPAKLGDYMPEMVKQADSNIFQGVSDHTAYLTLLATLNTYNYRNIEYFEKHVMLSGTDPLEKDWSVTFEELGEVLKHE